eukprot:4565737-Pyramimonas_sp.AAC.3
MNVDAQKYDPRSSVTIRTWANKWKRAPPHSASRWTLRAERQAPSLGTPHDHTSRRGEVSNSNTKSLARGQRTPSGVTRVGVCQEIPQRIFRALIQPAPRLPEPSAMAVCALFVLSRRATKNQDCLVNIRNMDMDYYLFPNLFAFKKE